MYIYKVFILSLVSLAITACGGGSTTIKKPIPEEKPIEEPIKKTSISLNGENPYYLNLNDTFTDPGATAKEDTGKDISSLITVSSSAIDTSKTGKYTIEYSVTDSTGKTKTKKRTVIINNIVNSGKGIHVNEFLAANSSTAVDPDFKQFSDWIELYNYSDEDINIGGYHISDDKNSPEKYTIPSTTIRAHGYKVIWADKKSTKKRDIHTNFKLSAKSDSIIFSDKSGNLIDDITFVKQKSDISASFKDNGMFYFIPSLKSENTNPNSSDKKSKKPNFTLDSGFYDTTQAIELTQENGGAIYYTTDGSIPSQSSKVYSSPISISKTTVIRARGLEDGKFLSSVKNHTYLINENITLPVVSIAIDNKYLYDDKIGIYTAGTDENGDPNPEPYSKENPDDWTSANYFHKWTRPASIEYIKDGKSQFSENVGIRIAGAGSRIQAQKSLAVYAKDKFGPKSIKYPLFPEKPYIKKVKSFVLRNSGSDRTLLMRDATTQAMIKGNMDIDYQSYQPTITFINGKYWGVLNIREKMNEDYIEANHDGVDGDNLDIVGRDGVAVTGTESDYVALQNYVKEHDMENDKYYQRAIEKIDLTEFMNYYITELYVGNWDWPGQNIKYWKEKKDGAKWRWMLFDTDDGFGNQNLADDNTFKQVLETPAPSPEASPLSSTVLIRGLMKNPTFKNQFLSRFTTYLNTIFEPNRIKQLVEELKTPLIPEAKRHFEKWNKLDPRIHGYTYNDWFNNVENFKSFFTNRDRDLKNYMHSYLEVSGSSRTLDIQTATNGKIKIDGVPLNHDYNGKYFKHATVSLKAIPNDGHIFVKWSNGKTNPEIQIKLDSDISITPEFQ